jgi:hypothetical protein
MESLCSQNSAIIVCKILECKRESGSQNIQFNKEFQGEISNGSFYISQILNW